MIERSSWEQHTKLLPTRGARMRAPHDCGPGDTLLITNGEQGYSAWCFRCAERGFIPHPAPSLSERLAELEKVRTLEAKVGSTVSLPEPRECDPQKWPLWAAVWLYKAGLSNDDIVRAGFYYHPPTRRVVLPVMDGTEPVFWQARGGPGAVPKYLNPVAVDRNRVVYKAGTDGPVLVLTEDILSAWRVSYVTQAWSLLGVNLPDGVATHILRAKLPVGVMLDPDSAGEKGNTKLLRTLSMYGVDARVVSVRRDPKLLTKEEIKCALSLTFPGLNI